MQSVDLLCVANANMRGRQQGPYHIALALQLGSALRQLLGDGCVTHIPPAPQQPHLNAGILVVVPE